PLGRVVMLNHIWERLRWPDGRLVSIPRMIDTPGGIEFDTSHCLTAFRLESGLPVWEYEIDGVRIEKRVIMPHLQNTTHISYRLLSDTPIRLELRPLLAIRPYEAPVSHPIPAPYMLQVCGDQFELDPGG